MLPWLMRLHTAEWDLALTGGTHSSRIARDCKDTRCAAQMSTKATEKPLRSSLCSISTRFYGITDWSSGENRGTKFSEGWDPTVLYDAVALTAHHWINLPSGLAGARQTLSHA